MTLTINNVPQQYVHNKKYIVACNNHGVLWFWDAYNDQKKAKEIAQNIGGLYIAIDNNIKINLKFA